MKKYLLLVLCTLCCTIVFCQTAELLSFNELRLNTNKQAMYGLGGWAIGNIVVGSALMNQQRGTKKYFHQMNVGWGAVNLGIASVSLWMALKTDAASFDLESTWKAQHDMQKILLFNAGLDIGYMMGGLYLRERASRPGANYDRLRGFGNSILLQGAFLFVFDLTVFWLHQKNNSLLSPLLSINTDGVGIKLVF